jgi:hypothetical protein
LCCDWTKRDSLLLSKDEFVADLLGLDPVFDKWELQERPANISCHPMNGL